jgi:hypothetical protein
VVFQGVVEQVEMESLEEEIGVLMEEILVLEATVEEIQELEVETMVLAEEIVEPEEVTMVLEEETVRLEEELRQDLVLEVKVGE